MPALPQETSYQDRLVALKLLRENMFYNDPKRYAFTDIAEDLPGNARAIAPIFKNVLPSAAIISKDPAERDAQIDAAIQRIKNSKTSKSQLMGEMIHNVKHLAPEAAKAGLVFSALSALLGPRAPWKRNAAGALRPQMPITPGASIKKLFTSKAHKIQHAPGTSFQDLSRVRHLNYLKHTAKELRHGGLYAGTYAAGAGALIPAFGGNYDLSDNALQEAKAIMQKDPYATSLPAAEMLSAVRQRKSDEPISGTQRVKNTLLGTGIGALSALPAAIIPTIIGGLGHLSSNALGRLAAKFPNVGIAGINKFLKRQANSNPLTHGVGSTMLQRLKTDIPNAAAWGGGVGALSGALSSNNPAVDEHENPVPN